MSEHSNQLTHEQRISDRFSKSMTVACLAGSFVHLFLSIFYFIIEVPEMFIYAVMTFFLFLLWRQLFKNKWIEIPFILGSLNSVTGIILANYFIGWESNFNIYFIILLAALFLYPGWKIWKRSLYLITTFCLYVILYLTLSDFDGISPIDAEILKYLSLLNTVSAVGILITVLLFFNSSIVEMQENLENKNRDLNQKADELDYSLSKEKELGQLKTSFVSTASHQFRTPLAVIQSNTELLEMLATADKKQDPEKYKKVTSRITTAISKMTDLMDDVLSLGKLTSGNVSYVPEDLVLVEFCEKLAEEFNVVQLDGRSIICSTKGEAYKVQLDPKLLTHSLTNLISNAFKYSVGKENPQLSIHFKPTEVVLSIKDYGLGIAEEEQLHLFEPFFRADNVTEIEGTGLGLSIAKEYVEINQGQISAKSTLGEGSCFEITFKR
jgi:signal transduction histidine kinase